MVETYSQALRTVDVNKCKGRLYSLWVSFARFYEDNGHVESARKIFEKGSAVEFKYVDDLASLVSVWRRGGNAPSFLLIACFAFLSLVSIALGWRWSFATATATRPATSYSVS